MVGALNDIEKAVLRWLESRGEDWYWFFGDKKLTKRETIRLFKEDETFRKRVVELVVGVAMEMFRP